MTLLKNIPKISIIMPVYNSENYLRRMADSVLAQTYNDFEFIIVNDGSTDGSGIICDKLSKIDNRVKVIHQENKGLPGARNAGMDIASGEYIAFVDDDDYILPNFYSCLIEAIELTSADAVRCEAYNIPWDEIPNPLPVDEIKLEEIASTYGWERRIYPDEMLDNKEFLEDWVRYKRARSVWIALWRRSSIGNLRFRPYMMNCQDQMFWLEFIANENRKIFSINRVLYLYFKRPGSLSQNKSLQKRIWNVEIRSYILKCCIFWNCENDICFKSYIWAHNSIFRRLFHYIRKVQSFSVIFTDIIRNCVKYLFIQRYVILKSKEINWKGKLSVLLPVYYIMFIQKIRKRTISIPS